MISVVGAGAMGTALAVQLERAGNRSLALLCTPYDTPFLEAHAAGAVHPTIGVPYPAASVHPHDDWEKPLGASEIVCLVVATPGLVPTLRAAAPHARPDALWVVATKGWEAETLRSAHELVAAELGDAGRVVALVGPSLAGEIAEGVPTAVVSACTDLAAARRVADVFDSTGFRVYTSDDVAGVEVGAVLKNVIAIGVGMCDGLPASLDVGTLTNTKAFLFSRGLIEMAALARALGGRPETVLGLAGAGDLFVTCLGGRNGRFGALVGAGRTPEEALEEMSTTVEGYVNGRAAVAIAEREGLDLPVVRTIARVLYDGLAPRDAIEQLIAGAPEPEFS